VITTFFTSWRKPPFPLVIALHGIYCDKAQVIGQFGPALVKQGFAVMAPDLPCHGERPGEVLALFDPRHPQIATDIQRRSVIDVRQCIDLAEERHDQLDLSRGVYVVGFSLGTWVACFTAGSDERVTAMSLCLAGAPTRDAIAVAPQFTGFDTAAAIARFHGPVLMLNAEHDVLIPRAWTERLFNAANEPKTQKWFDSGHDNLPRAAIEQAVGFLAGVRDKPREEQTRIPANSH